MADFQLKPKALELKRALEQARSLRELEAAALKIDQAQKAGLVSPLERGMLRNSYLLRSIKLRTGVEEQ